VTPAHATPGSRFASDDDKANGADEVPAMSVVSDIGHNGDGAREGDDVGEAPKESEGDGEVDGAAVAEGVASTYDMAQ